VTMAVVLLTALAIVWLRAALREVRRLEDLIEYETRWFIAQKRAGKPFDFPPPVMHLTRGAGFIGFLRGVQK